MVDYYILAETEEQRILNRFAKALETEIAEFDTKKSIIVFGKGNDDKTKNTTERIAKTQYIEGLKTAQKLLNQITSEERKKDYK